MAHKTWVWSPGSGGVKIPEVVKRRTEARIRRYAEEHFAGKYTRLEIRFRGKFCYIDTQRHQLCTMVDRLRTPGRADRRLDVGPGWAIGGLLATYPPGRWAAEYTSQGSTQSFI